MRDLPPPRAGGGRFCDLDGARTAGRATSTTPGHGESCERGDASTTRGTEEVPQLAVRRTSRFHERGISRAEVP
ncbi:hypothetical protein DEJ32_09615 [Curtobacterium sp. MCPF17_046]|nr:hypothetical protein DEJ32_09615 [Curtobacterium sp. MCPF17_046]